MERKLASRVVLVPDSAASPDTFSRLLQIHDIICHVFSTREAVVKRFVDWKLPRWARSEGPEAERAVSEDDIRIRSTTMGEPCC